MRDDTGSEVYDIAFNPPVFRGTIHYDVQNGQVIQGSESVFGSHVPLLGADQAATGLSLFWFDGAQWTKSSGLVNTADNTMSFTSGHAGRFQIRLASRASAVTLTRVYPRIFTPNGDGWNDKVIFQFDNPQLLPLSGKVYDISGAFVSNLSVGPNPDSSLEWDGKAGGAVVPGGIYVYQIDEGGSTDSGTVVVAR